MDVPKWVAEEWKSSEQNKIAKVLMDCNWSKESCFRCVLNFTMAHLCVWGGTQGSKSQMCFWYKKEQFICDLEIIVRKKSSMTVWQDEQWLSEKEMKEDMGWTANHGLNKHDRCVTAAGSCTQVPHSGGKAGLLCAERDPREALAEVACVLAFKFQEISHFEPVHHSPGTRSMYDHPSSCFVSVYLRNLKPVNKQTKKQTA